MLVQIAESARVGRPGTVFDWRGHRSLCDEEPIKGGCAWRETGDAAGYVKADGRQESVRGRGEMGGDR